MTRDGAVNIIMSKKQQVDLYILKKRQIIFIVPLFESTEQYFAQN